VCAVEGEWVFWLCISTRVGVSCVCSSRRVGSVVCAVEGEWGICVYSRSRVGELCVQ
jgi:hypothetical protein